MNETMIDEITANENSNQPQKADPIRGATPQASTGASVRASNGGTETDKTDGLADNGTPKPATLEPKLYKDDLVQAAPEAFKQLDTLADDVGLKLPSTSVPGISAMPPRADIIPPATPSSVRLSAPTGAQTPLNNAVADSKGEANLGDDIAKILKDVKLPERRDVQGTADRPASKSISVVQPEVFMDKPAPSAESAAKPVEDPGGSSVSAVHTLKQDLQNVVRDQKISVVRAVALEQDKPKTESLIEPATKPRRVQSILFLSLLFLVLGGAALGGVYYVMTQQTGTAQQPQVGDSLVFAEQTAAYDITDQSPNSLKSQLAQARVATNATLGSITRIVPLVENVGADIENGDPPQRAATLSEFLEAIGAHPPADLLRALGANMFFGIHTVDKNAPIIVVPVVSYDHAFAGMLAWEKTMNGDFAPIFTSVPPLTADENGLPIQRKFEDIVMRNYDVRALKDEAGNIQLYYSFPTRTILVIAESPYTFTEVLSRLQAGRRL